MNLNPGDHKVDEVSGIWSSETLRSRLGDLVPEPCKETRVANVAIELCLGSEVFISGNDTKQFLQLGQQIAIPPGQMALLLTEERIHIPSNAMGFISMKSGVKLHGLVNVSGFHVDPGYDGHLVFSVSNSGPASVPLTRGEPLFMLFLCSMDRPTEQVYTGSRRGLNRIQDEMVRGLQGHFPSPQRLQDQIKTASDNLSDEVARLRHEMRTVRWWASVIGAVVGVALSGFGLVLVKLLLK